MGFFGHIFDGALSPGSPPLSLAVFAEPVRAAHLAIAQKIVPVWARRKDAA